MVGESLKSLDAYYGNSFANDLPPLSGVNEDVDVEAAQNTDNTKAQMNGGTMNYFAGFTLLILAVMSMI